MLGTVQDTGEARMKKEVIFVSDLMVFTLYKQETDGKYSTQDNFRLWEIKKKVVLKRHQA